MDTCVDAEGPVAKKSSCMRYKKCGIDGAF